MLLFYYNKQYYPHSIYYKRHMYIYIFKLNINKYYYIINKFTQIYFINISFIY